MKIFGINIGKRKPPESTDNKKIQEPNGKTVTIPPGRISVPPGYNNALGYLQGTTIMVEPDLLPEIIPIIRALTKVNSDMYIAATDMVRLINTGHTVRFDNKVSPEKAAKMLKHIENNQKSWAPHNGGMYGVVNKMIMQVFIAGAISFEAVPSNDLDGVGYIAFPSPESIRFKRELDGRYSPYQKSNRIGIGTSDNPQGYIKLNPATFKYCAVNGDEDSPYGIPPFLSALEGIATQKDMRENINNIMRLLGILGYLEVSIEKPSRNADESESAYNARLTRLLKEARVNIHDGMHDGVLVGYAEDHEYTFESTTASLQNVSEVWNINQQTISNGLGVAGSIIGLANSKTEGGTSIMFTKLLSQLKNIQFFVKDSVEFIYRLHLVLAGFDPEGLKVVFNQSTITDDLKYQQGQEILIRNAEHLFDQGIISQEEFARLMGYDKPDKKVPRVKRDESGKPQSPEDKAKREKGKDDSDRRSREKKKDQPKRGDGKTKPV